MSKYFIFNENELEEISFNNGRIIVDDIENEVQQDFFEYEDVYDDDVDVDVDDDDDDNDVYLDIYSDNHPWDSRQYNRYRFRPDIWMLSYQLDDTLQYLIS